MWVKSYKMIFQHALAGGCVTIYLMFYYHSIKIFVKYMKKY